MTFTAPKPSKKRWLVPGLFVGAVTIGLAIQFGLIPVGFQDAESGTLPDFEAELAELQLDQPPVLGDGASTPFDMGAPSAALPPAQSEPVAEASPPPQPKAEPAPKRPPQPKPIARRPPRTPKKQGAAKTPGTPIARANAPAGPKVTPRGRPRQTGAAANSAEQIPTVQPRNPAATPGGIRLASGQQFIPNKNGDPILVPDGGQALPTIQPGGRNSPPQPVRTADATAAKTTPAADAKPLPIGRRIANLKTQAEAGTPAEILAAHREASAIYWKEPQHRKRVLPFLTANAKRIFFDKQPNFLPPYEVQPGDILGVIAKNHQTTWQYLALVNGIDNPRDIKPGQSLKIIRGPFSAVVDLSTYELTVHYKNYFVRQYRIGIGADHSRTPVGEFTVLSKDVQPQYTRPDGGVVAGGAPDNPLGPRWLGLDLGDGDRSYGIHGTIDPQSIGKSESRGCVRMRNADVVELFDLLDVGSQVIIRVKP